jgi:hypothetical protein
MAVYLTTCSSFVKQLSVFEKTDTILLVRPYVFILHYFLNHDFIQAYSWFLTIPLYLSYIVDNDPDSIHYQASLCNDTIGKSEYGAHIAKLCNNGRQ